MIIYAILLLVFGILTIMLDSVLGAPVTELPWGLDTPLTYFMTLINNITYAMPWLDIVWTIFLLALAINVVIYTIELLMWFIKLVRG